MLRTDLILPLINVFLLTAAGAIVLLLAEKRWKLLSSFRLEKSSVLNLAIARVVIISTLVSKISLSYELSYSRLDGALIVPPLGWAHLAAHVPRNPNLITILYVVFVAFGALAIVGLYGRLACFITSAAGFYLLTLPQLFGKINHDHNLILFGFILAASPCCDALSVDVIRNALRAARRGTVLAAPKESTAYADPLKSMMVLIGLIYFFPGAWKIGRAGIHWFSADNMRWMMARKLLEAPHITPLQMWAMHHPLLLVMGAAFTPIFELGFLFAILSPRTRPYAAICGLAFHNMTAMLMNINFVSLQLCYVIFVDWSGVFSWIALRLGIGRTAGKSVAVAANSAPDGQTSVMFRPLVATFVLGMILAGLTHSVNAWPIACYPTFDHVETGQVSELFATATSDDGRVYNQNLSFDSRIADKLAAERYDAMIDNLLRQDVPVSKRKAAAVVNLWRESYSYPNFKEVTLYCDTFAFDRDGRPGPLIQNREIAHLSERDGLE